MCRSQIVVLVWGGHGDKLACLALQVDLEIELSKIRSNLQSLPSHLCERNRSALRTSSLVIFVKISTSLPRVHAISTRNASSHTYKSRLRKSSSRGSQSPISSEMRIIQIFILTRAVSAESHQTQLIVVTLVMSLESLSTQCRSLQ